MSHEHCWLGPFTVKNKKKKYPKPPPSVCKINMISYLFSSAIFTDEHYFYEMYVYATNKKRTFGYKQTMHMTSASPRPSCVLYNTLLDYKLIHPQVGKFELEY